MQGEFWPKITGACKPQANHLKDRRQSNLRLHEILWDWMVPPDWRRWLVLCLWGESCVGASIAMDVFELVYFATKIASLWSCSWL